MAVQRILSFVAVDCSHPGGVQSVARSLEEGLERRGYEVRTFWSEPTDREVVGAEVLRLHVRTGARLLHWPSLLRCLFVLAVTRPSVVHCHFLTARIHYFTLLRRFFGFRLVLSAHGSDVMRPWPKDKQHLGRLLRSADRLTAVSEALAHRMAEYEGVDRGSIAVVPNGVDTRRFSPASVKLEGQPQSIDIVSVGRLERVKGHDVLLDAMGELKASGRTPKLTIVGDGEARGALVDRCEAMDLSEDVEFAGAQSSAWIAERLSRADIFVLPSRSEGTPVALLEAMSCGLACIATAVGGVPVLMGDAGVVVPAEDPAAIGRAIRNLIDHPEIRRELARSARARALRFSAERNLDQYSKILAST